MGQRRKIMGLSATNLLQWDSNNIISRSWGKLVDKYNDIRTRTVPPVFIDENTRVIYQGIPDEEARRRIGMAIQLGTKMVGVVTSRKGVTEHVGLPVFNTVEEAKAETKANASVIYASPQFAASAILEAIEAELDLVVCITKGIPQHEMVHVQAALNKQTKTQLIGPNSPGIIKPGECQIGIWPGYICQRGCVGIALRSSTLMFDVICQKNHVGLGQSTCVGIGDDPFNGTNFVDCLKRFVADPQTKGILLIGKIGGTAEEDAAAFIKESRTQKPVVSLIAGLTPSAGRLMGRAGAITSERKVATQHKINTLREAGVTVVESPEMIGGTIFEVFKQRGLVTQGQLKAKEFYDSQCKKLAQKHSRRSKSSMIVSMKSEAILDL